MSNRKFLVPPAIQDRTPIGPDECRPRLQRLDGWFFFRTLCTRAQTVSVSVCLEQKRRVPMRGEPHAQAGVRSQGRSQCSNIAAREIFAPIFQDYMIGQRNLLGMLKTHGPDGSALVAEPDLTHG